WNKADPDAATSWAPYHIYNIGNNQVETLMHFIEVLEDCLGKKAAKNFMPMQDGDVAATYANIDELVRDFKFKPATSIESGLENFVKWYRGYYG
ncbi:MAG: capsular biosynthesis protein CpsI, partial [Desulfobulbaceae bacterium]|nr:capsular biosynthesis protein CpsI [Desulfobulbaceae bacterium]